MLFMEVAAAATFANVCVHVNFFGSLFSYCKEIFVDFFLANVIKYNATDLSPTGLQWLVLEHFMRRWAECLEVHFQIQLTIS